MSGQSGIKREPQPILLPPEHPSRRASRATVVFEESQPCPTKFLTRAPGLACLCGAPATHEDLFCGQCGGELKKPAYTVFFER